MPITLTINQIFETAVRQDASDVHLVVGRPPIIRVNGQLVAQDKMGEITKSKAESLVLSILNPKQKELFLTNRELEIAYEHNGLGRFRINLHFEKGNPSLAARIIKNQLPTMAELGMPEVVFYLARMQQGLILFTGPTGCGKSTSLAAIINLINQERSCNIITLEDPIEFSFKSNKSIIRQRQYGSDFLSFPEALKHVLRQDPNVIMIGEMRDLETISAAITIAETGHLVLATLHTPNAAQTIDRVINIFPPYQQDQIRVQLSMSLIGVISQQLIPTPGREARAVAREIMINTPAIANLIRENKIAQLKVVIQTSSEEGMTSMDQCLKQMVDAGQIDRDTAKTYAADPGMIR